MPEAGKEPDGEFDDKELHLQFLHNGIGEGVTCQIGKDGKLPNTWILLDNQSTVDVFCNGNLLTNIRTGKGSMNIHCNAGIASTDQVGDLPGYGTVWYHPKGIANILSLSRVKENGYHVTYDSNNGNKFVVHKPDGSTRVFEQSNRGLYYLETSAQANGAVTMVNTVADNRINYTNRAYSRAVLAREIQKRIGRPSYKSYLKIVENNLLPNCPINRDDIIAAERIFGADVGTLKGKTVRRSVEHVEHAAVTIPASLMSQYRNVLIGGDIMFVNGLPFFVTISRNIKFCTAQLLPDQKEKTLVGAVRGVRATYMKRGFHVEAMFMDGQFEPIRGALSEMQITLNTVARGEHVPEIERQIRTIKERARCVFNTLPFKKVPGRMVAELIYFCIFWLNSFPANDGISDTLSPRAIVTGSQIDFGKHCKLEFGAYVQAHEEHDNSMLARTTGAIALRPTGNAQGGYYLYSLSSGRVINRSHWTPLPMPNDVIDRVHVLARRTAGNVALIFADRHGTIIPDPDDDDDDHDEDYEPPTDNDDDDDDTNNGYPWDDNDDIDEDANDDNDADIANIAGVNDINRYNNNVDNDNNQPAGMDDDEQNNDNNEQPDGDIGDIGNNNDEQPDGDIGNINEPEINVNEPEIEEPQIEHETEENENENENDNNVVDNIENEDDDNPIDAIEHENEDDNPATHMDRIYGERTGRYDLRARKPRDYSHLHVILEDTVMTQHSIKRGLKEFGEAGVDAVLKELQQLHDRKVLEPMDASQMSREEKRASLQYLMFLKKKRNGVIKGRGCADGRKQRVHTSKEEASSPTVAIEAVMLSCVIDALENRDVATVDIPGAFMQADMDEVVHMKLEGKMAELLVRIDPKLYRRHVLLENGKQVLYVELKKALYGTLKAALLFWRRLSGQLIEWGFKPNPYDSCVMNKVINGAQCTILWHVDDLKISHVDREVVTEVIDLLEKEFGKEAPLTKTRGNVHEYLGMTIDYGTAGNVKFSMIDSIQNMLETLPDDMNGESITPASNYLFTVDRLAEKLDSTTADLFHHNTAKLLFLCKRARPDIQTAVAFLCTRVQGPDVDDYKKLGKVMRYLRSTIDMPLTLGANGTNIIKWWADASYATHPDMKSHTGGAMSLGYGVVYGTSTRQKLNTTSSTEAELVGVNDVMPQVLWTKYFLEEQGFDATQSVIYQDNQSAMLLEKNGRASSGKRTRHINIRYFFVKDRIDSGEVSVEYCPTKEMLADYFTKPLQGSQFKVFRNLIMNANPPDDNHADYRSVLKSVEDEQRTGDEWTMVQRKTARQGSTNTFKSPIDGSQTIKTGSTSILKSPTHGRERKVDRARTMREYGVSRPRLSWSIDELD